MQPTTISQEKKEGGKGRRTGKTSRSSAGIGSTLRLCTETPMCDPVVKTAVATDGCWCCWLGWCGRRTESCMVGRSRSVRRRSVGGAETIYGYLLQLFSFRACLAKQEEEAITAAPSSELGPPRHREGRGRERALWCILKSLRPRGAAVRSPPLRFLQRQSRRSRIIAPAHLHFPDCPSAQCAVPPPPSDSSLPTSPSRCSPL